MASKCVTNGSGNIDGYSVADNIHDAAADARELVQLPIHLDAHTPLSSGGSRVRGPTLLQGR